ncbi:FAD-dependent oxidoreductase [Cellulomonas sp. zg-ZUI22]|uniref:NAD(P)/FAD-dependent oxidoreductase n=1 Tax=Cellulomonas sp. zg-ZUI22 TaxID=2816955 RepID=UPI001A94FB46|nr:FAD-binding oxidoreductase [Cellulomonas sp. zg-ZUI22]MBO0900714.1 FAD-dependent oxidoreductase [Cellulomonas sp. zg-ZUI22]
MGPAVTLADVSLWWEQVVADDPAAGRPRPPLDGDTTADVVVVGAGYTGLWTAYYLLEADPSLDVLVLDAHTAGFGASGRNGGWCSALFPVGGDALARRYGPDAARAMRAAMRDTVVEVGGVTAAEQIDCDFRYGGTVTLARGAAQLDRVAADVTEAGRWGDELHLLDPQGVATHVRATDVLGGAWTPDCARVQPARLVHGLARVVEQRGARIAEGTRALRIAPRAVVTDRGTARCRWVVRATEGWTATLPDTRRALAPVYSLMIATAPLPADVWSQIGLEQGQTFTDARHLLVYGQRTADDRLAFGGRGAPYHVGSTVEPAHEHAPRVHAHLRRALVDLFPSVAGHAVTHSWGGPLGVPRDWHPSVGLDTATGIGWAGGYVGDGVATANLAGRTLADLVTGAESPLTRLPWVGHRSPPWEPEPLRWAGITAARWAARRADRAERRTGRAGRTGGLLARVTGG